MLDRQREFVADASHELRTPLTSVLANLELLTEELAGEQAETAEAALRSTRRMRRLVGDLLLLARADARRVPAPPAHRPGRGAGRGGGRAGADGRAPRACRSHAEPVIGRGRARRAAPAGAQPARERACATRRPAPASGASTEPEDGEAVLIVEDAGPGSRRAAAAGVRAVRPRRPRRRPGLGAGPGDRALGGPVARRHGRRSRRRRTATGHPLRDPHPADLPAAPAPVPASRRRCARLRPRRRPAGPSAGGAAGRRRTPPGRRADSCWSRSISRTPSRAATVERPLDLVADVLDQLVGLLDERHAAEDDLGRDDRLARLLGHRGDDDEDPVGRQHAAVAQGDVGRIADVDAVDEDHPGRLGARRTRHRARRSPAAARSRPRNTASGSIPTASASWACRWMRLWSPWIGIT